MPDYGVWTEYGAWTVVLGLAWAMFGATGFLVTTSPESDSKIVVRVGLFLAGLLLLLPNSPLLIVTGYAWFVSLTGHALAILFGLGVLVVNQILSEVTIVGVLIVLLSSISLWGIWKPVGRGRYGKT